MKKNPFLVAGFSLLALAAAACNTVEGAGEDVEATGEAIEDTANDAGA
ncbi:MAG: entericidin, EcnA/B family [Henriciella sp.]|nr:entericidin A/B family lipoprotein [Henriciella sp.]MAN74413.1 entericidin, EcnA/B family [Henriciella sp.]MBF35203.1 entericidin, EcnA/B family [Hyphomonadaceae bacterium]MBK75166.1 entericidin, EcnA/B family [Henriciella sp.]PHR72596.1 MAG: entericidin, EcnA/B family [Henriciella sp.]|tara:strand:- start:1378 stop:1521 length:144 start_codon:yes stop_codon:yes gene_type:complete